MGNHSHLPVTDWYDYCKTLCKLGGRNPPYVHKTDHAGTILKAFQHGIPTNYGMPHTWHLPYRPTKPVIRLQCRCNMGAIWVQYGFNIITILLQK